MAAVLTPMANAIVGMIFLMMGSLLSMECHAPSEGGDSPPTIVAVRVWWNTGLASKAVRWHPIIFVDPSTVVAVRPVGQAARSIAWGSLEPSAVEIDDVPALTHVVLQHPPGKRMIALAHPQEAPERHHGICDLAGNLVDQKIVHQAEVLALKVIHCGSDDLSEEIRRSVSSVATGWSVVVVV